MVNKTNIQWTDYTSNPMKYRDQDGRTVWGCVKVAPGCKNCYAEALAKRYGRGGPFDVKTMAALETFVDEKELKQLLSPRKTPPGSKVFVGDMTDIFGEWVPFEMLDRIFAVMALRPDVTFQVLTKRTEQMREYLSLDRLRKHPTESVWHNTRGQVSWAAQALDGPNGLVPWPLPNVWLGCSVEDQPTADERIPKLLATPAAVRFVSFEPALAEVRFERAGAHGVIYALTGERSVYRGPDGDEEPAAPYANGAKLDWVIVGGESGPGARPCDLAWIRSAVSQCKAAGVAVFVKQLGAKPEHSPIIHGFGADCGTLSLKLRDRHGGDPAEWPEDLRVREFPSWAGPPHGNSASTPIASLDRRMSGGSGFIWGG